MWSVEAPGPGRTADGAPDAFGATLGLGLSLGVGVVPGRENVYVAAAAGDLPEIYVDTFLDTRACTHRTHTQL